MIVTDLDAIKAESSDNKNCLTEMLTLWLKQVNPPPTWSALVMALRQPAVGERKVAQQIEEMHISTDSTNISAEIAKLSFPLITEIVPSEHAREELEHRLRMESKEMFDEFRILRNKFFDSIEKQNITVDKLVEYLEEDVCEAMQQQRIESEPTTFAEVKLFIKRNSTFYDYQLIKYMIKLVGTDEDKAQLEQYEKTFSAYAKRRVYECPSVFSNSDDTKSELHVKLDSKYDKCKLEELKDFQYRLCSILRISVYVCRLKSIEKGCLLVIFAIPSHIKRITFPLSSEQEKALFVQGVLQLTCGDYQFPDPEHKHQVQQSTH